MQTLSQKFRRVMLLPVLIAVLATPLLAPAAAGAEDLFGGAKNEACAAVGATDSSGKCDRGDDGALKKSENQLSNTVADLLSLLTAVVGIICIIMIIISGIRFVTANGDANKVSSAKNTFIYALVGLLIVAFAQILVKLVLTRIS